MCFSAQVSLATFGMGAGFSGLVALLPKPEDKVIGIFLGFVSLMQLIEYGLWKTPFCNQTNKRLTQLAVLLNHAQPLVLILVSALYFPSKAMLLGSMALVYIISMVLYSSQHSRLLPQGKCTLKDSQSSHLRWTWNELSGYRIFYTLFIGILATVPLVAFQDKAIGITISVLAVLGWTVSAVLYPSQVVGALWCFFTAFGPGFYYWLRQVKAL